MIHFILFQVLDLTTQFSGCLNECHLLHLVTVTPPLSLHLHIRLAGDAVIWGTVQLS